MPKTFASILYVLFSGFCSLPTSLGDGERPVGSCDTILLPGQVIGCRGTWTRSPQCPAGWRPCTTLPPAAVATCRGDLKGFFASAVLVGRSGADLRCGPPPGAAQHGFAGCGIKPQLGDAENLAPACQGFALAIPCSPATGYLCGPSGIASSSNQFAKNGVLCCR